MAFKGSRTIKGVNYDNYTDYQIKNNQNRGVFSRLQKQLTNSKKIGDSNLDFYKHLGVLPSNITQEGSSKNYTGSAREFSDMFQKNPQLQEQALKNLGLDTSEGRQKFQ